LNDFPDDLKEFATNRCPQGTLAFYQEIAPAYVGTCEEMGWAAPTAIAVILDDNAPYGVIDCVKIDGQWRTRGGVKSLVIRCFVEDLLAANRVELGPETQSYSPLPLLQELGIED